MDAFQSLICLWALNWAPNHWAPCSGQQITLSQNPSLYSLLGSRYGGDDRNYFCLPDLRGRVPIGYGQGPGLSNYPLAAHGGYEGVPLSVSQLPPHNHTASSSGMSVTIKASSANGTQAAPSTSANTLAASANGRDPGSSIYNNSSPDVALNVGSSSVSGSISIGNTGNGNYHENRQPFLAINFIICVDGLYPPRP